MKRWTKLCLAALFLLIISNLFPLKSYAASGCEAGMHNWCRESCQECGVQRDIFQYGAWEYAILGDDNAEIVGYTGELGRYDIETALMVPQSVHGRRVISIGAYAINGLYDLSGIIVPDGVTSIGDYAFGNNCNCKEIAIPDSVVSVGKNPLAGPTRTEDDIHSSTFPCYAISPAEIDLSKNHSVLTMIDGVLFDKAQMRLISYPASKSEATYTIPAGIQEIDAFAFAGCSALENIVIPDTVTTIGVGAFQGCTGLKAITLPASVTTINGNPFHGVNVNVTVTVSSDNPALKVINGSLMSMLDMSLIAYLPEKNATHYAIPQGTKIIGSFAFSDCPIKEVSIPSGVYQIQTAAFCDCDLEEIDIPAGVQVGDYAFYNCRNLRSITLQDGVVSIDEYAFQSCSFSSVHIPGSVAKIGAHAFESCSNLEEVIIQEGVTSIGNFAFWDTALRTVNLPVSLTALGTRPFSLSPSKISISPDHPVFEVRNDTLFDKDKKRLIYFDQGDRENLFTYVVPEGICEIGDYAFLWCNRLQEIVIPDSVTSIGEYAFYFCTWLERAELPDSISFIGNGAFQHCSAITSLKLPSDLIQIGCYSFSGCSFDKVVIPDDVTSIGSFAFSNCTNLTEISLPDNLAAIGNFAFLSCWSLNEVLLPNSVEYIECFAFMDCRFMQTIQLGSGLKYIGPEVFFSCEKPIATVERNSYAEQYCKDNGINYQYTDIDRATK